LGDVAPRQILSSDCFLRQLTRDEDKLQLASAFKLPRSTLEEAFIRNGIWINHIIDPAVHGWGLRRELVYGGADYSVQLALTSREGTLLRS